MGPVVAAAGTFIATVAAGALSGRLQRGLENVEDTLASACQQAGMSPIELDAWAQESDGRLLLTCAVVQAAFTTLNATKLRALSRAYATGLEDDAKVDETRLIVACLVDLEPVHLQVLKTRIWEANPHNENVPALNGGTTILSSRRWEWRDLSDALPHIDPLMLINVLGTLQRHGLDSPCARASIHVDPNRVRHTLHELSRRRTRRLPACMRKPSERRASAHAKDRRLSNTTLDVVAKVTRAGEFRRPIPPSYQRLEIRDFYKLSRWRRASGSSIAPCSCLSSRGFVTSGLLWRRATCTSSWPGLRSAGIGSCPRPRIASWPDFLTCRQSSAPR
jgi:DNA-binding HxlR family transcriptional regulator